MGNLLDFLKKVVTRENVNCIPNDLSLPDFFDLDIHNIFKGCKQARYGFMHFSLMSFSTSCIKWLLDNFVSIIDFEKIMLSTNATRTHYVPEEEHKDGYFVPLLQWCAVTQRYGFLLMLLKYGVLAGAEEAFSHFMLFDNMDSIGMLERMLQKGIGINYLPLHYTKKSKLIQKYKSRRDRCESVVVRLLSLLRFKKTRYFSGLDPRLLKQMVVTPVWETRYSECWDTVEVKKLKI